MDTNVLNYEEIVEQKLRNELEVFAAARGKSNIHKSLSGTAEQISVSYKGRTLIELIQNGYDPHPPERNDGEIAILLDLSEGANGCLYVANRGVGFAQTNFEGLCDIARSSKVINQGIGNKGFGFRSVRQICKYPEIYSKAGEGSTSDDFDGFCFAFPSDQQLRELLTKTEHADYADEIVEIMPRLLLPVFTPNRPGHVPRFAKDGFATVIRMSLDREDSATDIRDQINAICDNELPIQLFLNRIAQIKIEVLFEPSDVDDETFSRQLPRHIIEQWTRDDIALEIVQIDGENQYLVSKFQLPDAEFRPKLRAGIESQELPESWADWKDPAEISVAVPLNGSGRSGRLYNFLPMESAAMSPCAGHINAPFLCDIDRKKLVDDVDLNDYFLTEAAALCLSTANDIKESYPDLARFAVVDLTMWLNGLTETMVEVAQKESGHEFKNRPLVPAANGSERAPWASLEGVCAWPETDESLRVLTADMGGASQASTF